MMARNLSSSSNGEGHNSGPIDATALQQYVERAARLMEEQKALGDDLKELCSEADEAGACSKKELRRLARESLIDQAVLQSQIERMDELRHALGMFGGTPLGKAAVERATRPRGRPRKDDSLKQMREALNNVEPYVSGDPPPSAA